MENNVPEMYEPMQAKKMIQATASRIGFALAVFITVQQVLAGGISLLVQQFYPNVMQTNWYMWVLSYGPLYLVGFPLFILVVQKLPDYTGGPILEKRMTIKAMVQMIVSCVSISLALNIMALLVSTLVDQLRGKGLINPIQELVGESSVWLNLFFLVIAAPLLEEYIFRHLLYKKLIVFGGKAYVIFSAFLFALLHPNVFQLFYAFLIGLILGGVRYFYGKVRYTVILHMTFNFIGGGMGSVLENFASEEIVVLWGSILLGMAIAGVAVIMTWWRRKRPLLVFEPGAFPVNQTKWFVLNIGMLFFIAIIGALLLLGLLL